MYVFWRKTEDPPSPWTRLTRTNRYLRFDSNTSNHWVSIGSSTHKHSTSDGQIGNSVHNSPHLVNDYDKIHVLTTHTHSLMDISNTNGNNNPIGFGLDIIYMDLDTWESSVLSFPEGAVLMSSGILVDANLERYTLAEGKFIVHTTPETVVGTTTPHDHTISGSTGFADGATGALAVYGYGTNVCDASSSHTHDFSFVSEAKYVEPKKLLTRLYKVLATTSQAIAGTVVFVDGSVSENWEILTDWAGGSLYAYNCNPTLSGSDTHDQTFSGNSSEYNGPNSFDYQTYLNQTAYDSHYHTISGNLDEVSHLPISKKIIAAKLLLNSKKNTERIIVVIT